jgi:hypothetical protein
MKKVLIAVVVIAAFGFVSCKKCQTCTTTTSQSGPGFPAINTSSSQEYCGKEYDDAPEDGTVNQSFSGYQQTVVITCSDK